MQKETGTLGRGGVTCTGRKQTPARLVDRHSNTASKAASLTGSSHLSRLPRRFPSIGGECVRAGLTVPGGSDQTAGGRAGGSRHLYSPPSGAKQQHCRRQGLGFAGPGEREQKEERAEEGDGERIASATSERSTASPGGVAETSNGSRMGTGGPLAPPARGRGIGGQLQQHEDGRTGNRASNGGSALRRKDAGAGGSGALFRRSSGLG
nr:unnamed protein product [Digitaria exilis]